MDRTCCLCGAATVARGSYGPHDVCETCSRALLRLSAHLESLDLPIAILSADLTVISANSSLRNFFDRHGRGPVGLKIGEVLNCKYAMQRRRCGRAPACLHCDLKRLVGLSRASGEKLTVMSTIFRHPSGASSTLTISTEKAGEGILLTLQIRARNVWGRLPARRPICR